MTLTTLSSDRFEEMLNIRRRGHYNSFIFLNGIFSEKLSNTLHNAGAIIAGGSVLASITPSTLSTRELLNQDSVLEAINDLDIYVNLKNAQKLYMDLIQIFKGYLYQTHTAPPYDTSFLVKNNIMGRYNISMQGIIDCDIMIVSDDVTVESVVENFDLSFCKVWYNGRDILTHHYQDIQDKKGTLGPEYVKAYIEGNKFTLKRIHKYNKRGFTVSLENINISKITIKKFKKEVISPEIWVVYKLLELLIPICKIQYDNSGGFSFMIFCLQKLNKYQVDNRNDTIYTLEGFKYLMGVLYSNQLTDFWTIDMLIYVLLCSNTSRTSTGVFIPHSYRSHLCTWITPKYQEYFKSVGIQLKREIKHNQIEPAHGFDNFDIPLCSGEVPPFSAGKNGFPEDIERIHLVERVQEGLTILALTNEAITEIYYLEYPEFRPESYSRPLSHGELVTQHQSRMSEIAARFADDSEEEEEIATESYDLPGSDTQVPGRCFSIMDAGDINTSSWYPEERSILFLVEFYPGAEPELVCTNTQVLQNAMDNESGINYRCGSRRGFIAGTQTEINLDDDLPDGVGIDVTMTDIDYSVEYIPFSYGIDGTTSMNGYLPRDQVERMMTVVETGSGVRLFTLEFLDTIPHTVSKNNTQMGREEANFVSTNHCQAGSTIMVFRVKEFTLAQERSPPALQRPGRGGQGSIQRLTRSVRRLWDGEDASNEEVAPRIWNDGESDDEEDDDGPRRLFDGDEIEDENL